MILENLAQVREYIDCSIQKRTKNFGFNEVKLIAVTKNHDIYAMRKAIDAGINVIGENRVQEALDKYESLERTVEWHLIGHLQTNKVKQAIKIFDVIQSVDSEKLVLEINRVATKLNKIQDILVQINVAREESKFGIEYNDVTAFIQFISNLKNVHVCGLMTIAPHYNDSEMARPTFRKLYEIFDKLKQQNFKNVEMKWLSMGMTNDYKIAIEEGANIVRIGTGIFGARQY